MNNILLEFILRGNAVSRKNFGGIILNNQFPGIVKGEKNFIINICLSKFPCHFIVCQVSLDEIIFFDSCGVPSFLLENKIIDFVLRQRKKKIIYNKIRIQSDESVMCSIFSLLYIYFINSNLGVDSFFSCFDKKDLKLNDEIACELFKRIF